VAKGGINLEAQLKKGIIETAVLATLVNTDSYGYKIVQDLSGVADISESTLYPILKRLENQGSLKTYNMQFGGRLRKYYSITPFGRDKIRRFLNEWHEVNAIYNYILNAGLERKL
jgi:PadR family transcriptional regulator PadR